MDKWDQRFFDLAAFIADWSKDPSTKVGAVIVHPQTKRIVSTGFNGFPSGVEDAEERLKDRAIKYEMVVHAEQNALVFAGPQAEGGTLYVTPLPPCARCAVLIIQAGIKRVRGDTFGYLQRSFLGCVSDVDQREAREVGEKGVQFAHAAGRDGTVTIHRVGNYATEYQLTQLEEVAGKTKVMSDDMIAASGSDVTSAFIDYAKPLLGSGMPEASRFQAPRVAKILA